jgi:hypothetical protein
MELDDGLPVLIDEVQQRLCEVHNAIHDSYFSKPKATTEAGSQVQSQV